MPEIKNQFTAGKMNKDLDEILVPKGQYVDAMNIQISTSDESNVGAIENLLGNEAIELPIVETWGGEDQLYDCVGSFSDERQNASYWFLSGRTKNFLDVIHDLPVSDFNYEDFVVRDYIIKRVFDETTKTYMQMVVFTDRKKFYIYSVTGSDFGGIRPIEGGAADKIRIPYENINNISIGDTLTGIWYGGNHVVLNSKVIYVKSVGPSSPENYIILDNLPPLMWFVPSDSSPYILEFTGSCLQFNYNNLITSVNIVNDLLFWTDNINEPKVINIDRSVEGSDQTGVTPTKLINHTLSSSPLRNVISKDINVIKRKPTKKLTVEYSRNKRDGLTKGTTEHNFNTSYNQFSAGFQGEIEISSFVGSKLNYEIGDVLLLLNTQSIEDNSRTLPYEFDVKLVIEDISFDVTNTAIIQYKIISISTLTPKSLSFFSVVLDERSFEKFENEMLRFSYRYRYLDKEVSAFAPFTDLIFEASKFHYTKDTAYNIGMSNVITNVKLKDFIDLDNTLAVESVDLLVKFEGSPLIYIIDTIKRNDFPIQVPWFESAFDGEYDFNPKNIKGVLPENQMLRPWDAVPLAAKSQEVIGNRIVYGNYLSSYDFDTKNFQLNVSHANRSLADIVENYSLEPLSGLPSIKSKRNYQLGIVLVDDNGRESPIFTNADSSVEISKVESQNSLAFLIENNCVIPSWAKSYKYYVKDSSLPSYNIVVDAFYKAENGDFWIAVPSSERNKIQEGDFLELKKGIDSDNAVEVKMNTKAISIKNEVPEFIGTTWRTLGKQKAIHSDDSGTVLHTLFQYGDHVPQIGATGFKISKSDWKKRYSNLTGYGGGTHLDAEGLVDLAVKFTTIIDLNSSHVGGVQESKYYNCGRIALDNTGSQNYHVTLDEPIRDQDDWITDSPTSVNSNVVVEFFEKIRLPRPQFQGKFFVKIEAKEDLRKEIAPTIFNSSVVETKIHEFDVHSISEHLGGNPALGSIAAGGGNINYDINGNLISGFSATTTELDTYEDWKKVFSPTGSSGFGSSTPNGETVPTYWFIDRLQYYRQIKEKVWSNNSIRIESTPDNTWGNYPPIAPYSKRYGLGVFISDTQHVSVDALAESAKPKGEKLPYYTYDTQTYVYGSGGNIAYNDIGSPDNFVNEEGRYYMEISLLGCFEELNFTAKSRNAYWSTIWANAFYVGGNIHPEHWNVNRKAEGNSNWPYDSNVTLDLESENQKTLDHLQNIGQKFKFIGTNEVYTIKDCQLEWRFNYANGQEALDEQYKKDQGQAYDQNKIDQFLDPLNRRLTAIIEVDKNPLTSTTPAGTTLDPTNSPQPNIKLAIQFLEQKIEEGNNALSTSNPAVFEAEKIDEEKLDIYYEASDEIPIDLNIQTLKRFIPEGSKVIYPKDPSFLDGVTVATHKDKAGGYSSSCMALNNSPMGFTANTKFQKIVDNEDKLLFITPNGNNIYLKLLQANVATFLAFDTEIWVTKTTIGEDCAISLSWYNCFSFGNGVESTYLKDSFNESFITKGVKVSASLQGEYKQERKLNGLIYSGLYNKNSETNDLNQFIQAEKITKEINPSYGSIQKLHARSTADGDLIALCEDRVLKILANKDAVYNADGNPQLIATENVLGQAIPYSGEYGISKNPESFASESYRCYFTDKVRGVVLRLSKDGLTPISNFGMKDWFRDHLKLSKQLIGSYDSYKKEYNITLHQHPELVSGDEGLGTTKFTVSFKEDVKGWVSFKSFAYMQNGLSCSNDYYTYYNNHIWLHNSKDVNRNTFYNVFYPSSVDVILNDNPEIVKTFHTVNYEGSQGRVNELKSYETYLPGTNVVTGTYSAANHNNLYYKAGWNIDAIYTNKERGQIQDFVEKEGKWFNYIRGMAGGTGVISEAASRNAAYSTYDYDPGGGQVTGMFDVADTAFQGLGTVQAEPSSNPILGCTDSSAFNYNSTATYDDPDNPCIAVVLGCTDNTATNYDSNANTDDGSCLYPGCIDSTALNFDINANTDDGSCIYPVYGCIDPTQFNYDANANTDDGSCIPFIYGCTDPTALNHNSSANTDDPDNPCTYNTMGCTDNSSIHYDPAATADDGSCYTYSCNDGNAVNFTSGSTDDTECLYCGDVSNVLSSYTFAEIGGDIVAQVSVSWDPPATVNDSASIVDYTVYYVEVAVDGSTPSDFSQWNSVSNLTTNYTTLTPLDDNVVYAIVVKTNCWDGVGLPDASDYSSGNFNFGISPMGSSAEGSITIDQLVTGCSNVSAGNYDCATGNTAYPCSDGVNYDDGSCLIGVPGCTDTTAFNFDNTATVDDGTCIPVVLGCTYNIGVNDGVYDPSANTDDGSCISYVGFLPGDATGDGLVNLDDQTMILNNFGQIVTPYTNGDIDGDGIVGVNDLNIMGNNWLSTSGTYVPVATNYYNIYPILERVENKGDNLIENSSLENGLPLGTNGSGWSIDTGANINFPSTYGYDEPVQLIENFQIFQDGAYDITNCLKLIKHPVAYQDPNDPNLQTQGFNPKVRAVSDDGTSYTSALMEVGKEYEVAFNLIEVNDSNSDAKLEIEQVASDGTVHIDDLNIDLTQYNYYNAGLPVNLRRSFTAHSSVFKLRLSTTSNTSYASVMLDDIRLRKSILPSADYQTFRAYAKFVDPVAVTPVTGSVNSITGIFSKPVQGKNTFVTTVNGTFYNQSLFGQEANLQHELQQTYIDYDPAFAFDTFLTIGDTQYLSAPALSTAGETNLIGLQGSFNEWTMHNNGLLEGIISYPPGTTTNLQFPDSNGRILLGQFTTSGTQMRFDIQISGQFQDPNNNNQLTPYEAYLTFFTYTQLGDGSSTVYTQPG